LMVRVMIVLMVMVRLNPRTPALSIHVHTVSQINASRLHSIAIASSP
jgi:uncharacterized membrane protein YgaE (UPF0421/DUF939 family)